MKLKCTVDRLEQLERELAEANARRADLCTALEWSDEERERLREQRDELERWKGEHQYSVGLSMALEQRDEARAEVGRCRLRIESDGYAWIPGDGSAESRISPVEAAYRRGAEAMREACAQRVEGEGNGHYGLTGADVAKTLRALPIPEER